MAGAVGYGIYCLTVPKRKLLVTATDVGRKWLAWTAMAVTVSTLPPFFRLYSADTFLKWVIGLVFYGGLAFVVGWIYGRIFKFKAAEGRPFELGQPTSSDETDTNPEGPRTHYDNLQVSESASPEVIKGAYKYLSQKYHPDKNAENRSESERITRLINEAYAVLSDPQRRKEHDEWIRVERAKVRHNQHEHPPAVSEIRTGAASENPDGFFKRAWFILLFATSVVIIFGAFPYQLIAGGWKWSHLLSLTIWLAVGHYAYTALFHPEIVAEEKRQETERKRVEEAPRNKATKIGWIVCASTLIKTDPLVLSERDPLFARDDVEQEEMREAGEGIGL